MHVSSRRRELARLGSLSFTHRLTCKVCMHLRCILSRPVHERCRPLAAHDALHASTLLSLEAQPNSRPLRLLSSSMHHSSAPPARTCTNRKCRHASRVAALTPSSPSQQLHAARSKSLSACRRRARERTSAIAAAHHARPPSQHLPSTLLIKPGHSSAPSSRTCTNTLPLLPRVTLRPSSRYSQST